MSIHNENVEQVNEIILRNLRDKIEAIENNPRQLSTKDITVIGFQGYNFKMEGMLTIADHVYFRCFGEYYLMNLDVHELAEEYGYNSIYDMKFLEIQQVIIDNRTEWKSNKDWEYEDFEDFNKASELVSIT